MILAVNEANLRVRLQPNARRDELVAVRDGVLLVRVAAPALEGRANRALCRLLAERLNVPRSHVTVVRGKRSRDKVIKIEGADQAALDALLST
jgi:uncharacterized protein (TIGR00251 family)